MTTRARREQYTFEKRLAWRLDATGCKGCGDSTTHKYPGWATRHCKPLIYPDQFEQDKLWSLTALPDNIPTEDCILFGTKEWQETSN